MRIKIDREQNTKKKEDNNKQHEEYWREGLKQGGCKQRHITINNKIAKLHGRKCEHPFETRKSYKQSEKIQKRRQDGNK
jgi:S-adenosylmethionine:diacylglycerol 3-amino-3-carboxypropyl transferase